MPKNKALLLRLHMGKCTQAKGASKLEPVRKKTNVAIAEVREDIFTGALRWLQLGAPHGVVGAVNDVGFRMDEIVLNAEDCEGSRPEDWQGKDCGAVCCILGYISLTQPSYVYSSLVLQKNVEEVIGRRLSTLLFPSTDDLNEGLDNVKWRMGHVTPDWAAAVLHNYIQVGEVDWKLGRPA